MVFTLSEFIKTFPLLRAQIEIVIVFEQKHVQAWT